MIVTTACDALPTQVKQAQALTAKYGISYYPRLKYSIPALLQKTGEPLFVVNQKRGLSYYSDEQEVFFHPNMSIHRIKQLATGQKDSLISACQLQEGMRFFDGTLGLAADSLVASYVVGDTGEVVAVEKSRPLAILVTEGLAFYALQNPVWAPLIKRLAIQNVGNLDYLRQAENVSFDVVYYDFMFNRTIESSKGIQVIKPIAAHDVLTKDHVTEAVRVAKKRVVVKSDYSQGAKEELEALGFTIEKAHERRHFFYAIIDKGSE